METIVYLFCALTSMGCALLLWRSYAQSRVRLVLWGALFFVIYSLSNIVLFFDLGLLPPQIDLSPYRDGLTLVSLVVFIFGLIKEGDAS